jgi:DNA invertase Pin-like site-specific DNA recombinase
MCKYYGYVRVSTGTQAEKGYGLDAQRDEIKRYCAAQGIALATIFEDAGISGNIKDTDDDEAIGKRAGLIEMLATLEPGDAVIVLNTSRLWRSDMTKAIVRREIMRKAAKVTSIEQPKYDLYSKDPGEYLINAIMEALDVYDRMTITLKLARGRTVKAKGGDKPAGAIPYGYQYSADRKHVEVNEAEAATVKRMFSLAQTGESLSKITDKINATGATTRRGKPFSKGTIAAVLNNRFYTGELTHAGQTIQGNHTPIISKIQFGKVQSQLAKRKK